MIARARREGARRPRPCVPAMARLARALERPADADCPFVVMANGVWLAMTAITPMSRREAQLSTREGGNSRKGIMLGQGRAPEPV
jgi:hypothetical protein